MIEHYDEYSRTWEEILQKGDVLQKYRSKELMRLIEEMGPIDKFSYELMLKTLDHIEIGDNCPKQK